MLRWRLLLGAVLIAALVGLCWFDWHAARPGFVLLPLAVVAALLAAGELLAMFRKRGHDPLAWVVYSGVLLTVLAAAAPGLWPALPLGELGWLPCGLVAGLLLALMGEMRRYDGARHSTVNLSLAVFAVLYVGGLVGFLVALRLVGGGDGKLGMFALVSLIAVVKMSDVGQYTVGRLFGKHKLAPSISPGKTWEGVLGGAVFACVAAWLMTAWAAQRMLGAPLTAKAPIIQYALALTAAGIVGDLAESMLKRDAGVKDSSEWMPGFGGVLDLLDSLLVAAPVGYLFWSMGWATG